jgi:phage shock protein C
MTSEHADNAAGSPPPPGTTSGPEASWTPPGYGAGWQRHPLYRSSTDRVWAGVCGGLAEHFGWDPSITRLGYALLTIFTGIFPMLIVYIVMAIVIPEAPWASSATGPASDTSTQTPGPPPYGAPARASGRPVRRSGGGAMVLGVLFVVVGGLALVDRYVYVDWSVFGPAVVIVFGVLLIALAAARRPQA